MPRTINLESEKKELRQRQRAQAKHYNRLAKNLPSLSEGDVVRMKPFKLGDKSQSPNYCMAWRAVVRRWDGRWSSLPRTNWQHLQKTSEPPAEPIITEPEPNITSAGEDATRTTTITPYQSNIAHQSHPGLVTAPEQCRRSERVRKSPTYLKDYVYDLTHDFTFLLAIVMVISVIVYWSSYLELTYW